MRGEACVCGLLACALGLLLAIRPPAGRLTSCACFVLPMLALAWMPLRPAWRGAVCQAGWLGVMALAAALHLPASCILKGRSALLMPLGAGCLAGAAMAFQQGAALEILAGLPLIAPASLAFGCRFPGLAKIVSGWLAAIALLNLALACLPLSPGYVPDHLD